MKSLNRKDILAAQDIAIERVEVPEWGGSVFVKGMTGAERDWLETSMVVEKGKSRTVNLANFRAKLASMTICNEQGVREFEESDCKALGEKSSSALQRVYIVSQRLSLIREEDIKELTEALEEDPFEDSPTD